MHESIMRIMIFYEDDMGGNEYFSFPSWEDLEGGLERTFRRGGNLRLDMSNWLFRSFELYSVPGRYTMVGAFDGWGPEWDTLEWPGKGRSSREMDEIVEWSGPLYPNASEEELKSEERISVADVKFYVRETSTDLSIAKAHFKALYETGNLTPEQWKQFDIFV